MGLLDALKSSGSQSDPDTDDSEDAGPKMYQIVARDHQNRAYELPDEIEPREWVFEGEHPTKEQFEFEYGSLLEGGISYTLVAQDERGRPDFDEIQWTIEQEAVRQDDELSRVERKLDELREEPAAPASDQPIEDQVLGAILRGQVDIGTAMQVAEVKKAFNPEPAGEKRDYFQSADLSDKGEVATAAIMNMMSEYDSVGDAVQDVMGGAMSGAMDVGPAASVPQQPAAQPAQQATTDGAGAVPTAEQPAEGPDSVDPGPGPADGPGDPADGTDEVLKSPMQERVEQRRQQASAARDSDAVEELTISADEPAPEDADQEDVGDLGTIENAGDVENDQEDDAQDDAQDADQEDDDSESEANDPAGDEAAEEAEA